MIKLGSVKMETRSCSVIPFLTAADSTSSKVKSWIKTVGATTFYCEFDPGLGHGYSLADGQLGRQCALSTYTHDCTK